MFCSNCGSKVADGSKFCSNCGAKIAAPATKEFADFAEKSAPDEVRRTDAVEAAAKPAKAARGTFAFDWSEVLDESHKKEIPQVRSPWTSYADDEIYAEPVKEAAPVKAAFSGSVEPTPVAPIFEPSYDQEEKLAYEPKMYQMDKAPFEDDLFSEMKPSAEPSRTMNFIDVLKKEREDREKAAAEERRYATERQVQQPDFSEFDRAPVYEATPAYASNAFDTASDGRSAYAPSAYSAAEERTFEESSEVSLEDELAAILAAGSGYSAEPKETDLFAEDVSEPEYKSDADIYADDYMDYQPKRVEGRAARAAYEEEDDEFDLNDESFEMDDTASFDAIPAFEEVPAFEEAPVLEDEPALEDISAYEEIPVFEEAEADEMPEYKEDAEVERYFDDDEAVISEPSDIDIPEYETKAYGEAEPKLYEEPVYEPAEKDDYVDLYEQPAFEEEKAAPVVEEEPAEESEIEALKRRLAELLAKEEPAEEIVKEEVPTVEAILGDTEINKVPEAVAVPETDVVEEPEEFDLDKELAALGFGAETVKAEPVAAAETAEPAPAEEVQTDAMSLDELENELFGGDFADEAEATRKIDKFYTLYRKNEEFQKLLDEEYDRLQVDGDRIEAAGAAKVTTLEEMNAQRQAERAQEEVPAAVQQVQSAAPAQVAPVEANFVASGSVPEAVPAAPAVSVAAEAPAAAPAQAEQIAVPAAVAAAAAAAPAVLDMDDDDDDDDEEEGGKALLIVAVVIAVILVLLLGVILVLNFAPDSGIAVGIQSLIDNLASRFSLNGSINDDFLL